MSLDGLRAWIGEVERKLGMRTRVFLVLVAIAVGGAGAAIYLAAEAGNDQVSAADLRAVESASQAKVEALESRIAGLEASREATPRPESPSQPKQ
jgi:uncharacterized protein YceH (UPF0502 family)